ncbi:MAG: hypothetical protein CMF62_03910 [Magnetococcales bacterium]|nr:hypothetical protein [Magnetococcales bacterium]|tara:strand:+ start:19756 stop:20088 length:333 start_codon:yes stop_codon:yes gene_type:complete
MDEKKIKLILIQVCEAHSDLWPSGLNIKQQKDFKDRVTRANEFVNRENVPFKVLIDSWDNTFEQLFQSWPDKFYMVDKNLKVLAKSEYGEKKDALINLDYSQIIETLLEE